MRSCRLWTVAATLVAGAMLSGCVDIATKGNVPGRPHGAEYRLQWSVFL